MATVTKIHGLEELKAKLAKLPTEIGRKVLRKGVSAGATKLKGYLKTEVPRRTGTLQRAAITKFVRQQSNDTQAVYIVTFKKGKKAQARSVTNKKGKTRQVANADAYYASWVEFGHKIVPRKAKGGKGRSSGGSGRVEGKHFLRDSFARHQGAAIEAMKDKLTVELRKMPEIS